MTEITPHHESERNFLSSAMWSDAAVKLNQSQNPLAFNEGSLQQGPETGDPVRSGAAARIQKYKYHHMLAFLRPVLAQRISWSSTLEPGSSSGAVPHRTATDQSQPSTSDAASGPAPQAGEQAADPSGVPVSQASATGFYGSCRQRQKASDRTLMSEFIHLSSVFENGLKVLGDRLESGLTHVNTLFQAVN